MTMLWKKQRLSQWQAAEFSITETLNEQGAYRLEAVGTPPEFFDSLEKAKAHAGTLNTLTLTRQENERLRAELARLRNPATALVEATRQPATAAGPESWADDGDGPWSGGVAGDEGATDPSLAAADDGTGLNGRGIPAAPSQQPSPVDSAEVAAISGRLNEVMARNGQKPRIFASGNN